MTLDELVVLHRVVSTGPSRKGVRRGYFSLVPSQMHIALSLDEMALGSSRLRYTTVRCLPCFGECSCFTIESLYNKVSSLCSLVGLSGFSLFLARARSLSLSLSFSLAHSLSFSMLLSFIPFIRVQGEATRGVERGVAHPRGSVRRVARPPRRGCSSPGKKERLHGNRYQM